MPYIETVEELADWIANAIGIYGVDRIDFVSDMEDRIIDAVENDRMLNEEI